MEKLLYTKKEAAKLLSISTDTLDRLRADGQIQGFNLSDKCTVRVYFKAHDLKKFVERMEVAKC